MLLPQPLFSTLATAVRTVSPDDFHIQTIVPVTGGDINQAYQINTRSAAYFVKVNPAANANRMFLAESNGLALLRATPGIEAPRTFTIGQANDDAFLLMEWLPTEDKSSDAAQERLGRMAANLHRRQADTFGLDHDNFIGSLPQSNTPSPNWTAFFIRQRLQYQLNFVKNGLIDHKLQKQFEQLFARLDTLYPQEPASLLHGDLWGGNYLITSGNRPVLIDPAVYYGHREMDIAMTKLFGGFSSRFYAAYHEAYPLQRGWEQRIDLWNLYPLLVHFNLFGESYLGQLQRNLRAYL